MSDSPLPTSGAELVRCVVQMSKDKALSLVHSKAIEVVTVLLSHLPSSGLPSAAIAERKNRHLTLPDKMMEEYYQGVANCLRDSGIRISLIGIDTARYRTAVERQVFAYTCSDEEICRQLGEFDGNYVVTIIKTY